MLSRMSFSWVYLKFPHDWLEQPGAGVQQKGSCHFLTLVTAWDDVCQAFHLSKVQVSLLLGVVVDSVPPCRFAFEEGLAAQLYSPRSHPSGRAGAACLQYQRAGAGLLPAELPALSLQEPGSVLLYFTLLSCCVSPRKQAAPLAVSAAAFCLSKGF